MLPDKETREFIFGLVPIFAIMFFHIYNLSQLKLKKQSMSCLFRFIILNLNNKKIKSTEHMSRNITIFAIVETLVCGAIVYSSSLLNNSFGRWVGTGANYFGLLFFLPLFMIVMSFSLWANPLKQGDFFVPGLPLALAITKIACFTSGCCHGVWWPGGPYSYRNNRDEFPIQLVEAGVAFLLFLFFHWYKKRAKTGTVLPLYTILYSATRFVTEFWRGQELVWGPLRFYHILCIIGFVLGIIELAIVLKYGKKISSYFENTFYFSRKRKQMLKEKEALKS